MFSERNELRDGGEAWLRIVTADVAGCARSGIDSTDFADLYSRRLVLGWIDSYDSNQILIFSGFSRSTKLSA